MDDWVDTDTVRRVRTSAEISVARACGFAGLGTLCLMIGLSGSLAACLKGGGYAALLVCAVLVLKAGMASSKPFKDTEVWIMLDKGMRPGEKVAQQLISEALRQQYLRFASYHAAAAVFMLAGGLLAGLSGRG